MTVWFNIKTLNNNDISLNRKLLYAYVEKVRNALFWINSEWDKRVGPETYFTGSIAFFSSTMRSSRKRNSNDVTATSASISWTCYSNCSVPGFIVGYRLVYYLTGLVPSPPVFVQVMGAGIQAAVLTSLKPYSTYRVHVQAMTASGRDGLPSEVWVTTKEGGTCRNIRSLIKWSRDKHKWSLNAFYSGCVKPRAQKTLNDRLETFNSLELSASLVRSHGLSWALNNSRVLSTTPCALLSTLVSSRRFSCALGNSRGLSAILVRSRQLSCVCSRWLSCAQEEFESVQIFLGVHVTF